MANLKGLNGRIATLKNMQKVMRAMNMIATVKLRKIFRLQASLTTFEQSVDDISGNIYQALKYSSHPLLVGFEKIKKFHVVIFTADKGLCGSHNSSIHKALDFLIKNKAQKDISFDVTCVGMRGANYCKRKEYDIFYQTEINDRSLHTEGIKEISLKILKRFLNNEIQEIYLISNYFRTTLHQDTLVNRLVPFNFSEEKTREEKKEWNAGIEPEPTTFVVSSQELYVYYKFICALFHSYLSEHSSRMTAMENATKNSEDLINHYVALQNRARQASITNDLIEIISGKEALKG